MSIDAEIAAAILPPGAPRARRALARAVVGAARRAARDRGASTGSAAAIAEAVGAAILADDDPRDWAAIVVPAARAIASELGAAPGGEAPANAARPDCPVVRVVAAVARCDGAHLRVARDAAAAALERP